MGDVRLEKSSISEKHGDARRFDEEFKIFAAIVDSSNDAIIGKTLDGTIISWNKGAENIYGYAKDEVLGKNVSLLAPPGRADEVAEILEKIRRGERVDHFETIRVSKDGKRIHVSLTISPITDIEGRIVGASTIARDITERRKMDDERLRLGAIVQSSEDAILGITLEGIITSWNQGAGKMLGYPLQEAVGKSVRILYPSARERELRATIST